MAKKGQGGEAANNNFEQVRSTRVTTLSPTIDNDHGKQTSYGAFSGEVPADPCGFLPKEKK